MGSEPDAPPEPRVGTNLLCVRCGAALFYVRQDRARGVAEHHFACRRCGQKHAAWESVRVSQVKAREELRLQRMVFPRSEELQSRRCHVKPAKDLLPEFRSGESR